MLPVHDRSGKQTTLSAAVISRLPLGLLGFFGIKNGGQYPQTIGNVILPQLEMQGILHANYHENLGSTTGAGGITALGFKQLNDTVTGLPLIVPASELWFVGCVTAVVFTGVGDSFTGTLMVRATQAGSASAWNRAVSDEITAVASQGRNLPAQRDFWLAPGDQIGAHISAFVNASGTAQLAWNFELTRYTF